MAALRAVTIQTNTSNSLSNANCQGEDGRIPQPGNASSLLNTLGWVIPKQKPINAKGNAKWYVRI